MTDIGALLHTERLRRNLTQEGMAKRLGLTRQKLQMIERGQPGVAAEKVLHALEKLGVLLIGFPSGCLLDGSLYAQGFAKLYPDAVEKASK